MKILPIAMLIITFVFSWNVTARPIYNSIWYELPQYFIDPQTGESVPKYSGAMGTATDSHMPTAIYSQNSNKTFFTYSGYAPGSDQMAIYVGCYNHQTKALCSLPTLITTKPVVDQHDNASILVDENNYIWVFVSGRATERNSTVYKSNNSGDISSFQQVNNGTFPDNFTYPQPWQTLTNGKVLLHTQYAPMVNAAPQARELFITAAGQTNKMIEGGHYSMSYTLGDRIVLVYNSLVGNHPDQRINLYYIESTDGGRTWKNKNGTPLSLPLSQFDQAAIVLNGSDFIYLKDLKIRADGNVAIAYVSSNFVDPTTPSGQFGRDVNVMVVRPAGITRVYTSGLNDYIAGQFEMNHNYSSVMIDSQSDYIYASGYREGYSMRNREGGNIRQFILGNINLGTQITNDVMRHHNFMREVYGRTPQSSIDFKYYWVSGHPNDSLSPTNLHYMGASGVKTMP